MPKVTKKPATVLYPVPVVLVSCGTGQRANIITLAWVGTLCSEPPLVGIGVRPGRYSHGLIKEAGEFVINLPDVKQVKWVDYCGTVSGRDEDKWAACGFTPAPASQVQVPLIAECPVNIECRVQQTLSLGSHDLFIGEVVAVQMDEAVLDERGRLDLAQARPFAFLNGEYRQVGELLGRFAYSRK
ncbi:MAG: flavin reductase family protein [Chloroflexi bacterium]|nr:flavin reductase family protein [Chloroflexota bacterium]